MRDSVTSPIELVALTPPDRTSLACPQLYCNRCTWIGNLVNGMKLVDKPIWRLLSRDIVWHLLQLGVNESDVLWSITPWSTLELGSWKAVNFPSWIHPAGLNIFCPITGMTKVTASAYQPLWYVTKLSGAAIVVVVVCWCYCCCCLCGSFCWCCCCDYVGGCLDQKVFTPSECLF